MNVNFKHASWIKGECQLVFGSYANHRVAILAYQNGSPETTATVNLPDEELPEDHVFIKDYAENESILQDLIEHNIISEPVKRVRSGHVMIPMCKLLVKP